MGEIKKSDNKKVPQGLKNIIDAIIEKADGMSKKQYTSLWSKVSQCIKEELFKPDQMVAMKLKVPDINYKQIHNTPGGLRLLVGAGFTFLAHPVARHLLAKYIFEEEKKIHGRRNKQALLHCLRNKIGSNRASAAFLDSIESPGRLTWFAFRVNQAINWISDLPLKGNTKCGRGLVVVFHGILPLFSVFLYLLDYTKDIWFFVYLSKRLQFINDRCSLLRGLIYFYGVSIWVAALLMSIVFQINSGILNLDAKFRIIFFIS